MIDACPNFALHFILKPLLVRQKIFEFHSQLVKYEHFQMLTH